MECVFSLAVRYRDYSLKNDSSYVVQFAVVVGINRAALLLREIVTRSVYISVSSSSFPLGAFKKSIALKSSELLAESLSSLARKFMAVGYIYIYILFKQSCAVTCVVNIYCIRSMRNSFRCKNFRFVERAREALNISRPRK